MCSSAAYSWTVTGLYTLSVSATNACSSRSAAMTVHVTTTMPYNVYLPLASKPDL